MEKICKRCGKAFKSISDDYYCKRCILEALAEPTYENDDAIFNYDCNISKPKARKKPQIYKDAKKAAEMGISYGEYMYRKERGKLW